jgi:hypothetical protein
MGPPDIIAICSAVVAVLALAATLWQGYLTRQHNRLSVRPLLVWHLTREATDEGMTVAYSIRNLGLGPAVVRERYFTKDGIRFKPGPVASDEAQEFLANLLGKRVNYRLSAFGMPGANSAIPSQGEVVVGRVFFPGLHPADLETIEKMMGETNFHLRYESMYREKFYLNATGAPELAVNAPSQKAIAGEAVNPSPVITSTS